MPMIEIQISLAIDPAATAPQVRAFVDLDFNPDLGVETELALDRQGSEWLGAFLLQRDAPRRFMYRIGIAADVGTPWTLVVRERPSGRVLLRDADALGLTKGWFVGTCELRQTHGSTESTSPRSR